MINNVDADTGHMLISKPVGGQVQHLEAHLGLQGLDLCEPVLRHVQLLQAAKCFQVADAKDTVGLAAVQRCRHEAQIQRPQALSHSVV